MRKGLEALERLKNNCEYNMGTTHYDLQKDNFSTIEKELKTLEIIKEHTLYCEDADCFVFVNITKEVNDLLKEVLL